MNMTDGDKRWLVATIETIVRDHFTVPVREEMAARLSRKLEPVVEGLVRTIVHRDVEDQVRRRVDEMLAEAFVVEVRVVRR